AIREQGLRITGKTAMIAKPEAATTVPQRARPDFVFVTTKAYDTANAMGPLERLADRSVFVTLQNGLGNAETIAKTARRVIAGTSGCARCSKRCPAKRRPARRRRARRSTRRSFVIGPS